VCENELAEVSNMKQY